MINVYLLPHMQGSRSQISVLCHILFCFKSLLFVYVVGVCMGERGEEGMGRRERRLGACMPQHMCATACQWTPLGS